MKAELKILLLSLASIVVGCNVERMTGPCGGDPVITDYLISYYALMTDVEFISSRIYDSDGIRSRGKYDFLYGKGDSLQRVYDDCHFNQVQPPGGYVAYVNEFRRIEITSDADFNDVPAGQSLAGKVAIMAFSPYIWLKSGSVLTYDWSDYNTAVGNPPIYDEYFYCRPQIHLVYKTLDTLAPDDLKLLLDDKISFHFIERPAIKNHNFTIRFIDNRQSYEGTVSVTFGS